MEYICTKCKTSINLSKSSRYCVCGGLLQPKVPNNINELFNGIFKGEK